MKKENNFSAGKSRHKKQKKLALTATRRKYAGSDEFADALNYDVSQCIFCAHWNGYMCNGDPKVCNFRQI